MIRKNDKLWGDFCRKRYVWNEATEDYEEYLELSTKGYHTSDPSVVIPSTSKTVNPEPEKHFSFSTMLTVMAIELYQDESERQLFATMSPMLIKNLSNFVESRKQMTVESYRFFIENAYNDFFHMSLFAPLRVPRPRPRTLALQEFSIHPQSLLVMCGLVDTKLVHVPEDQTGDIQMGAGD